jgi:hypothetical protein
MDVDCEVFTPSAAVTRLSKALNAEDEALVARPVVGWFTALLNEVIDELFDTMFPSAVETLVVNAPSALEVATTPVVGLLTVAVTD